jgi:sugar lactone lactonase YvrE
VFSPDASRDLAFDRLEVGAGPEDVALGPDGLLYTGLADGRIVRLRMDGTGVEDFAHTGGRPLGLEFDAHGALIVADGKRGLLQVTRRGVVLLLADRADGLPIEFADDLDIASDGTIYFSDVTTRFPHDLPMDCWEGQASGRLIIHEPATRTTTVLAKSLHYPNGVALGPGERYVLVCEMIKARVVRLWLQGPRRGQRDVFLDALPAYADNVSYDHEGLFWLALVYPRNHGYERFATIPFVRAAMMRVPGISIPRPIPWRESGDEQGCVVAVDTTGTVRVSLHDPAGDYAGITSANRYGDTLFVGSIKMTSIERVPTERTVPGGRRNAGGDAPDRAAQVGRPR